MRKRSAGNSVSPGGGLNDACSCACVWLMAELVKSVPPLAAAASSLNVAGTVRAGIREAFAKLSCNRMQSSRGYDAVRA
eukprot:13423319-Heterocapsa_arctica.AAC.1